MNPKIWLSVFVLSAAFAGLNGCASGSRNSAVPLVEAAVIEIPNSSGKFDFLEVDARRHRLLAGHENDKTADIFDLDQGRLLKRLPIGPVLDVAVDDRANKYFASVGDDNRVAVIDTDSLQETNSVSLPGPTDAIVFATKSRRVFAMHDNGTEVWVLDADAEKLVATIPIPGVPEYALYDVGSDRIYVNIKTKDQVIAIDPNSNQIVASWSTAPAQGPHGLAIDAKAGRLFSAGDNGKLAVIDLKTGMVIATADIPPKVDQIAFDSRAQRIYCACADWMAVVQETSDGIISLGKVKSAATARNVAIDSVAGKVWTTYTDGKASHAKAWAQP